MKSKSVPSDQGGLAKLQELVRDIEIAMVTTVTPDGALRSRPMATRTFDDDGRLWFFAADDSEMAVDLKEEHAVNVSYAEPKKQRYISVTGAATLIRNREKAREMWVPALRAYFPAGLDDPHLVLLCVRVVTAEYWHTLVGSGTSVFADEKHSQASKRTDASEHVKVEVRAAPDSG